MSSLDYMSELKHQPINKTKIRNYIDKLEDGKLLYISPKVVSISVESLRKLKLVNGMLPVVVKYVNKQNCWVQVEYRLRDTIKMKETLDILKLNTCMSNKLITTSVKEK